jgi:hypothetical protein
VCDNCFVAHGFQRFLSLVDLSWEEIVEVNDGRLEAFEAAYEALAG